MVTDLIRKSKELGFKAIGFSRPGRPLYFDEFVAWLSGHKHADMTWLERNIALRRDPSNLIEGCQTIISLAFPYSTKKPMTPDGFCVSRYACPSVEDYHSRMKRLCSGLVAIIKHKHRDSVNRICVDSAPVLERSIAFASGIGFIGKNNMLILPDYGSYFYLAEILTTAPLEVVDMPPVDNRCGSCTNCMEACPTGAIEKAFCLDASKCLSYLTIEKRGETPEYCAAKMGHCFFGCDRCQEACPFNGGMPLLETSLPTTEEFLHMEDALFMKRFGKTAFKRAGLEKLKSNIRAITGRCPES